LASNEWAVAYHGIGNGKDLKVKDVTKKILNEGFYVGPNQAYEYFHNDNKNFIVKENEKDDNIKKEMSEKEFIAALTQM